MASVEPQVIFDARMTKLQNFNSAIMTSDKIKSSLWSRNSIRLRLVVLVCIGVMAMTLMRNNLGIALVCMVNTTATAPSHDITLSNQNMTVNLTKLANFTEIVPSACSALTDKQLTDYGGSITWSTSAQSTVISMLFWGSILGALPAGYLADRFGAVNLMSGACAVSIVCMVMMPTVALTLPYIYTSALRFVMGLAFSIFFCSVNPLLSKWFPQSEKTIATAIWSSGNPLGSLFAPALGAIFCPLQGVLGGWPLIFYACAGFGMAFLLIFSIFATNSPDKNRFVSADELLYISSDVKQYQFEKRSDASANTPWLSLLFSTATIAVISAQFSHALFVWTMGNYLPTYFKSALKMDLTSNGLLSGAPFLCQLVGKYASSFSSGFFIKKKIFGSSNACKLSNTFAGLGTSAFVVVVAYSTCETKTLAAMAMCLAFFFNGFHTAGWMTSLISIAPAYSGVLSSYCRICAGIAGIVGPYIVSIFVEHGSAAEWKIVFLIIVGSRIAATAFFMVFGTSEVQTWALPEQKTKSPNTESESPKSDN